MAHLVRPQIVRHIGPDGKRCPKGTPGATVKKLKAKKWYAVGIPGMPSSKRVPLASDKTAAKRMMDDLCRRAEQGSAGLPDKAAARLKLVDHLALFKADLELGLATRRRAKVQPSAKQVRLTVQRVRDVLAGCGLEHPADLTDAAPAKVAWYLRGLIALPREDGGLSHQSATFRLADLRRFVWWLNRGRVPVRADLFDDVPGFDPSNNRVHGRRAVTPDELARVLEAALAAPGVNHRLSGRDRYHVYLTAFATGYRASELGRLTPVSFRLDESPPVVVLPGKSTKNKRAAAQPVPPAVAVQLRTYLADKPRGQVVRPGTWKEHSARMLRADLEAAGIEYAVDGPDGKLFADFHALRHSFVTALAAAGVGPKELQELARHSDPRLTLGAYSHTSPARKAEAVGRIALPGRDAPASPLATLPRADLEDLTLGLLAMLGAVIGGNSATRDMEPPQIIDSEHFAQTQQRS